MIFLDTEAKIEHVLFEAEVDEERHVVKIDTALADRTCFPVLQGADIEWRLFS